MLSSDADSESEEEEVGLTEEERNKLNAKILKAQLKGDKVRTSRLLLRSTRGQRAELQARVAKLEAELAGGKKKKGKGELKEGERLLTRTDYRTGLTVPVEGRRPVDPTVQGRMEERAELAELVREERMTTADDHLAMFSELAGKVSLPPLPSSRHPPPSLPCLSWIAKECDLDRPLRRRRRTTTGRWTTSSPPGSGAESRRSGTRRRSGPGPSKVCSSSQASLSQPVQYTVTLVSIKGRTPVICFFFPRIPASLAQPV